MLKISKNEYINADAIESICLYEGDSLHAATRRARETGRIREIGRGRGFKSFICCRDGKIFLAPYTPETYMGRLKKDRLLIADPKRSCFNATQVTEVSTRLTTAQKRELKEKAALGMVINLAGRKKTRYFVFTESGRIYRLYTLKAALEEETE